MLSNYDAAAVAGVMGISFRRHPDAAPSPRSRTSGARGAASGQKFVILLNDVTVSIVETRAGAAKHALWPPSAVLIEKAIEKGLPRQTLRHVAEWLAGDDRSKISLLEWGVVPRTTLERRDRQLTPAESERTERIARLLVQARRALGTEAEAREFMTSPHPLLEGRPPVEAAMTDLGTRRVEGILNALEYGLAL